MTSQRAEPSQSLLLRRIALLTSPGLVLALALGLSSLRPEEGFWRDSVLYGPPLDAVCHAAPVAQLTGGPAGAARRATADGGRLEGYARALLGDMNSTGIREVDVVGFSDDAGLSDGERRALEEAWIPIARSCRRLRVHLTGVDLDARAPSKWVASMTARAPFAGVALEFPSASRLPTDRSLHPLYDLLEDRGLDLRLSATPSPAFEESLRSLAQRWPHLLVIWVDCPLGLDSPELPANVACRAWG